MMKEALLYDRLPGRKVRCRLCPRECAVPEGGAGWCRTRANRGGVLYSLIYGKAASRAVSPIEKKPLFHCYPGSRWLSLGSLGCNFRCPGCQNYDLSFASFPGDLLFTGNISPEKCVRLAEGCKGISFTYNEPSLWLEYILDVARLAVPKGLLINLVTNGYISREGLDLLGPYLHSYRMDLKGFSAEFYRDYCHVADFSPILENALRAKYEFGAWVEIVTNLIPGLNDDEGQLRAIASWIKKELGPETPWHATRFHPQWELSDLPLTPVETLERAQEIGKQAGLLYVYLGNVPGHPGENTRCHACRKELIVRQVFSVVENLIEGGKCPGCGTAIPGRFENAPESRIPNPEPRNQSSGTRLQVASSGETLLSISSALMFWSLP